MICDKINLHKGCGGINIIFKASDKTYHFIIILLFLSFSLFEVLKVLIFTTCVAIDLKSR